MLRAIVASAIVHLITLACATYGVGTVVSWVGDGLAMGWAFILFLLLLILAFLIWLLFGTVAVAGMGATTAALLVLGAVTALGVIERAPVKQAASVPATPQEVKPLEVAFMADDGARPRGGAIRSSRKPEGLHRFSTAFGEADVLGSRNKGSSVKAVAWLMDRPGTEPVAAADEIAGEALSRQRVQGENSEDRSASASRAPSPTVTGSQARVEAAFARLAQAMPRLGLVGPRAGARQERAAAAPRAVEKSAVPGGNFDRLVARAEEGYPHAQFNLAEVLLSHAADAAEVRRARNLLQRAALSGHTPAQILLSRLVARGDTDHAPDIAQAHAWLSVAASQGSPAVARARDELAREFRGNAAVRAMVAAAQLKDLMARIQPENKSTDGRKKINGKLHNAVMLGDSEAVRVLLARDADADDADQDGHTPLIEAAWRGYPRIVDALVNVGAKLDARDGSGKDAISWAAINGHTRVIEKLAAAGAAMDIPDADGFTPLMRAAWNGHEGVVRVLMAAGADPNRRNRFGSSARDYAREQRQGRVLALLSRAQTRPPLSR